MATNDKDTSWKVKVRRFKSVSAGTTTDDLLEIPQKYLCASQWLKCQKPLGRPVNTNMAVKFIRNFLDDHQSLVDQFGYAEHNWESPDPKVKDFFIHAKQYFDKIAKLNYAMSLDKNMALKILSQPGCEGLRFYLCEKKMDGDVLEEAKAKNIPISSDQMETSLVVVGFDICGKDLNYQYPKDATVQDGNTGAIVPSGAGKKAIKDIKMQSLNVEYVTPPPGSGGGIVPQTGEQDPDEFVLLKYAKNQ